MRIGICDDDPDEIVRTKLAVENYFLSRKMNSPVCINTFTTPRDLLDQIDKQVCFDLLILDIMMPFLNGIELATEIRNKDANVALIFLTSSPDFALQSYKVRAFYYLIKPCSVKDLNQLLDQVYSRIEEENSAGILVKEAGKITRVQTHTILYIECLRHIIRFHLRGGNTVSCYGTINEYQEALLSDKRFIRCHKSFIINMNHVISISGKEFILSDKTVIPISRQSYQQIKNAYIEHFFAKGGME